MRGKIRGTQTVHEGVGTSVLIEGTSGVCYVAQETGNTHLWLRAHYACDLMRAISINLRSKGIIINNTVIATTPRLSPTRGR
jgi:hypothetical protein